MRILRFALWAFVLWAPLGCAGGFTDSDPPDTPRIYHGPDRADHVDGEAEAFERKRH